MLATLNIPSPTAEFVKDSIEAEEIKNFVSDYTYISTPSKLQERPILLKVDGNKLDSGAFFSSVHELQEHILYVTDHGNLISRNQREVVITRKDRKARLSFSCQQLSQGLRRELKLLSTPKLLKETGLMLQEENCGKGLILFQLEDLPHSIVYHTNLGATVCRKTPNEVSFDKFIISIPEHNNKSQVPEVLPVARAPQSRPPIVNTSLFNPAFATRETKRKSCTIGFHVKMKVVGGARCMINLLLDPKVGSYS